MRNIVLGLHKDPWHDSGAAVVATDTDGERVIVAINEERLDRTKNSRAFPERATRSCLDEFGIASPEHADLVVYDYIYERMDWRKDFRHNPCRTDVFLADIRPEKLHAIRHHLCHAAACFYTSPFNEAAILVVDGRGTKWETQTLWIGRGETIELCKESFCVGIGLLYEAVTQLLGFGFLEAGKTMALAPFGQARPSPVLKVPGAFWGLTTDYAPYCTVDSRLLVTPPNLSEPLAWERCACDIQSECERAVSHLVTYTHELTGLPALCLTGGVALNGVANNKVLHTGLFDKIFINPACSDSGIALGAALWGYHALLHQPRKRSEVSPFTGPSYPSQRIGNAVARWSGHLFTSGIEQACVELLARNHVIAHFDGRSEMGPRALGARSILMSPMRAENRDYLNAIIKRREAFRPFAPCVPLEDAETYFEISKPSPHMLFVVPVRNAWRHRLQAITHIDGTARVQTVEQSFLPRLHRLLTEFGKRTGIPILLNTSFNVAGQPLIETPEDAVACFMKTKIDALLIGNYLLTRVLP